MSETSAEPMRPDLIPILHQVERFASILSPIALATALLYYFGWVRTVIQARSLGYDASLSGFSTEDYVLKSINILFVPLIAVLVVTIASVALDHFAISSAADRPRVRSFLLSAAEVCTNLWIGLLPLSLLATFFHVAGSTAIMPVALTTSMLGILYGHSLVQRLHGNTTLPLASKSSQEVNNAERKYHARVVRAIVVTLLILAIFWDTERLARTMGRAYASEIIAHQEQLTSVVVFAAKGLAIADRCVIERRLEPDGAYAFRYDGLRLLDVSDGKNYFISICDKRPRIVVLVETDDIRIEFAPGSDNIVRR